MDYDSARFWTEIGQWVFNVIVAGYLYFLQRHQTTMKRIKSAYKQIGENEKDIVRLKVDFNNLPTTALFIELGREIRTLTKELSETKGRLSGINRAVDLINEHLINKDK